MVDERARFRQFEHENVELQRAKEILRLASAYFEKAELDRRASNGSRLLEPLRYVPPAEFETLP